jgi:hypothetical protein
MLADGLKVGDSVVVRGLGLGKLKAFKDGRWIIGLASKDEAEVKDEKAEALLRPPMTADEAAAAFEKLSKKDGEPDPRDWGDQYLELQRVLKQGAPVAQAEVLQRLYRLTEPDASQLRVLESMEDALLPELAHVLKKKPGSLRNQLHAGQPAFGYCAPERDESSPIAPLVSVPVGWTAMGSFRVFSGKMVVGEHPYPSKEADAYVYPDGSTRRTFVVPCENGEWFALGSNDEENEFDYVIGTRAAAEGLQDLLGKMSMVGTINIEGGSVQSPALKLPWSKAEGPYCLFRIA